MMFEVFGLDTRNQRKDYQQRVDNLLYFENNMHGIIQRGVGELRCWSFEAKRILQ